MVNKCFKCGREIGQATWDAQSAEQHRIVLELLRENSICETCEYTLMKIVKDFKEGLQYA